jgi:glutamine amidotransferase
LEIKDAKSWEKSPLEGLSSDNYFYFVHSYYVIPSNASVVLSNTTYGCNTYVSSIQYKNIFACQFHPEKSGELGLKIYNNWLIQNNLK